MNLLELCLHLPQRDEGEYRLCVLIGPKRGVGPKLVGGREQRSRHFLQVDCHGSPVPLSRLQIATAPSRRLGRFTGQAVNASRCDYVRRMVEKRYKGAAKQSRGSPETNSRRRSASKVAPALRRKQS